MTRLAPAVLLLALAACAARPPADPAEAALLAACRAEADRVMAARERAQLMRADEREAQVGALEGGSVRRGTDALGERFERDRMVADCIAGNRRAPRGN
ncbi:MAG: hypothetical protein NZM27_00650 [Acetobacteraceae bacterium]|nr:hypothetical protein [Acetobacteraceae bacterium]MCX7686291.1 hypothetical protein [Acetobacteraceae bacterium]MDW8398577.1 hypothetical protein [Acetobacteraceae bacterium]